MKRIASLTAAALLALPAPVLAQETDLTGLWKVVSGKIRTSSGETLTIGEDSTTEFVFENQDGPVFSGNYSWVHPEDLEDFHNGVEITNRAEEDFVGIIHPDGVTFTIADHPDTGLATGRIVDDNTIELVGYEAGEFAYVSFSVLVREE